MATCKMRERETNNFIHEYVKALTNGRAAVFAGAGLSIPSGEVSWSELLKKDAESIGLDITREDDLIEVAQYIYNESGTRTTITGLLKNHVDKKGKLNQNHEILATLPIEKYWTTNYDTYIERAIENSGKSADIKRNVSDLSTEIDESRVTIYKMHGDITSPDTTVLLKEDYEIYDRKNELFIKKLQGDLLSNTFLFIGFSFDDPNLESILAKLSILMDGQLRRHYCFLKKVSETDAEFEKVPKEKLENEVDYRRLKQDLKINDLRRYGIRVILVDEYEDITSILERIRSKYVSNRVFVSGAFDIIDGLDEIANEDAAFEFSVELGTKLCEHGFKVTSGLGKGVGRGIVTGFLNEYYKSQKLLSDELLIRPFPRDKKYHTRHREELLSNCGVVIFVFGNKVIDGNTLISDGLMEEYTIAKEKGRLIIAVPHTGYAAQKIWEEEQLEALDKSKVDVKGITGAILNVIEEYRSKL